MLFKQKITEETDEDSFASIISISNCSSDELLKVNQSFVEVSFYSILNFYREDSNSDSEVSNKSTLPIGKINCCKCTLF